jgi:hypothetical protein
LRFACDVQGEARPFREDDGLYNHFQETAPDLRRWSGAICSRSDAERGVVGLAGVIVAVIASAPLADKPPDLGQEALQ